MGWFSRNTEEPTQQFGAPTTFGAMGGGMGYGMQNGMMDPMQMQMMGQNPARPLHPPFTTLAYGALATPVPRL